MPKAKRNIGREILEGLREIKRGQHGRVESSRRCHYSRKDRAIARALRYAARRISSHTSGLGAGAARTVRRGSHTAADRRTQPEGIARCRVTRRTKNRPAKVQALGFSQVVTH